MNIKNIFSNLKGEIGGKIRDLTEETRLSCISLEDRIAALNLELQQYRQSPLSVAECMRIYEEMCGKVADDEWNEVITERLSAIWLNPDFAPEHTHIYDPMFNGRSGSVGMPALHLVIKPLLLDFLKTRLEALIPPGTKLTLAKKNQHIEALTAEIDQFVMDHGHALAAYRRLVGNPGANPRNPEPIEPTSTAGEAETKPQNFKPSKAIL